MGHRVIQWGTGNVGFYSLRHIIRHPDLVLVGLHAHSPDKIGKDAAALCGLAGNTGVIASNDVDAYMRGPLEKACEVGSTTFYVNGIDPGFSGDVLPMTALQLADQSGRSSLHRKGQSLGAARMFRRRRGRRSQYRWRPGNRHACSQYDPGDL